MELICENLYYIRKSFLDNKGLQINVIIMLFLYFEMQLTDHLKRCCGRTAYIFILSRTQPKVIAHEIAIALQRFSCKSIPLPTDRLFQWYRHISEILKSN